jgi:anaerobic glycerol-3-phosphate dehydrogenase
LFLWHLLKIVMKSIQIIFFCVGSLFGKGFKRATTTVTQPQVRVTLLSKKTQVTWTEIPFVW